MKLRIQDNSVRIRLTQSEVARLAQGQHLQQTTEFTPTSKLTTILKPTSQGTIAAATFQDNRITITLPMDEVRVWAHSERVGIESQQEITPDKSLRILIEKDFECLHSAAEGNTDAFPNPRLA